MKSRPLVFASITLFLIILVVGGLILRNQYIKPLGPRMALASAETTVPMATVEPTQTALKALTQPPAQDPTQVPTASGSPTAGTFCGQNGKMMILVVGDDASQKLDPPGSDLVRYVKVDFDQKKVTIFTFPRSLWVNTPALAGQNVNNTTLGKTYHFALLASQSNDPKPDEKQQMVYASQAVAQTVLDNFGLTIDHYVSIKLSNIPKLVDAIGGVSIDNPYSFTTDKYDQIITFPVGPQTLNGVQTAYYVRYVSETHSDWDRIERQNLVLQSIFKKLQDPAILPKIPGLFTQLADSMVTDLSPENIMDLTCVLKSVSETNIIQEYVHPDMITLGPEEGAQLPDVTKIENLLKSLEMTP
jgi:LCP family protein required for cell wall assembly